MSLEWMSGYVGMRKVTGANENRAP